MHLTLESRSVWIGEYLHIHNAVSWGGWPSVNGKLVCFLETLHMTNVIIYRIIVPLHFDCCMKSNLEFPTNPVSLLQSSDFGADVHIWDLGVKDIYFVLVKYTNQSTLKSTVRYLSPFVSPVLHISDDVPHSKQSCFRLLNDAWSETALHLPSMTAHGRCKNGDTFPRTQNF